MLFRRRPVWESDLHVVMNHIRFFFVLAFAGYHLQAAEVRIAVAANFADAIVPLAAAFEKQTGHRVVPAFGATGKFYVQIKQGAPFEIFLAADAKHPQLLESENLALPGTRFTYATGKIALWSPKPGYVDAAVKVLEAGGFKFIAIANPEVAPYGRAAQEYLLARKLWDNLAGRVVMGQDIGQAYQFVSTGNAELGFVALSQLQSPDKKAPGSFYIVPQKYYQPLVQQAIQIKAGAAAAQFLDFLKSAAAKQVIRTYGYEVR